MRKVYALVIIFVAFLTTAEPALACTPTPPPPPKYTYCSDLGRGYQFGFGIPARDGTYPLTAHYGKFTGGAPADANNNIKLSSSNGHSFDWNASLGIDAVIVQAGGKSKVKKLSEARNGRNFSGPVDSRGKPLNIERIDFCYDYELNVTTTAAGTGTSQAAWDITKTVAAAEQAKFAGEKATFDYTVAVRKTAGSEGGFSVGSVVKVNNSTLLAATLTSIKDTLTPGDVAVKLDCGAVSFPYKLPAGKTLTCTATTPVTTKLDGESQAVVKTSGKVGGDTGAAKIQWSSAAAPAAGPGSVTVTDTNAAFGGPFTVSADQTWTYSVELACPTDPAAYTNGQQVTKLDNTAAITETGQKASQSVTLNCYAPAVSSTTSASYDVLYTWAITKTSPAQNLTLQINATKSVDYTVGVSVASKNESNIKLSGAVTVSNPNPAAPLTATLTDEVAPGVPAALTDCTNPVTVPAGGSLTCNYAANVAAKPAGANTASVSFNNIVFTATAPFDFNHAGQSETDECVNITDSAVGSLGTVCADKAPATFPYSVTVGPYKQCGIVTYPNTASFVTNDTGTKGSANWKLNITVPCPPGTSCTRNEAYWASHANPSDPDTYSPIWNMVTPGGPSTPFLTTGLSWIATLQTDPSGKPYLGLAHSYIAAQLNVYQGARKPAGFDGQFSHAADLLNQYAATQDAVTGAIAQDFNNTASLLNNYNNGITGPGTCPDCAP